MVAMVMIFDCNVDFGFLRSLVMGNIMIRYSMIPEPTRVARPPDICDGCETTVGHASNDDDGKGTSSAERDGKLHHRIRETVVLLLQLLHKTTSFT